VSFVTLVTKWEELPNTAKLSIFKSVFFLIFTYDLGLRLKEYATQRQSDPASTMDQVKVITTLAWPRLGVKPA